MRAFHAVSLGVSSLGVGCSQDASQVKNKTALSRPKFLQIKTTAYSHAERSHRCFGHRNAVDGRLTATACNSASADWSRFPVGTKFRVLGYDRMYVVDDYGAALVGTNTIDLYMPSLASMRQWGTRNVTIELIELGSYDQSLKILKPRCRVSYVRRMVERLQHRSEAPENGRQRNESGKGRLSPVQATSSRYEGDTVDGQPADLTMPRMPLHCLPLIPAPGVSV
jgi:3D (Asp-Asp-Asp) domain-containing protein